MDENRSDVPEYSGGKRRRTPTSAAQKVLILLMLAALAVLVGIIVWVARYPQTTDVIDLLNRESPPVRFTQPITTEAVTETSAETTAETTAAETETTSAVTETAAEKTTTTAVDHEGEYKIDFTIAVPQYISGNYVLAFTYKDTGETTETEAFSIPDTVSADVELVYPQASTYVAADVYLKNTANGKQAFAGILNLDFANGLCDQSGIELYSAIDAVQ